MLKIILVCFTIFFLHNAGTAWSQEWQQKEFVIGTLRDPRIRASQVHVAPADYNNDGKYDIGVKIGNGQNAGRWQIKYYNDGFISDWNWDWASKTGEYGGPEAIPVPGDYDGDGKTDLAVFRPGDENTWLINYASNGFGAWDDKKTFSKSGLKEQPVPGDYDGDGKTDISIRIEDGRWLINFSADGLDDDWDWASKTGVYGSPDAIPVAGDYDGDGKTDLAVYEPGEKNHWYIDYARNGFGSWDFIKKIEQNNVKAYPAPADYDGDKKTDISVKTYDGRWLINRSADGFGDEWDWSSKVGDYGSANSVPVPADYDGDGRDEMAICKKDGSYIITYNSPFASKPGATTWRSAAGFCGRNFDPLHPEPTDLERLQVAKDAWFNLLSGTNEDHHYRFVHHDYYLALCSKLGIKTMIYNADTYGNKDNWNPTHFKNFNSEKLDKLTGHFKETAYDDAFYGYFMGDEPEHSTEQRDKLQSWLSGVNKLHPNKATFVNFYPYYAFGNNITYRNYINAYVNPPDASKKPRVISCDFYPFRSKFDQSFFYNLSIFKEEAGEVPFWFTLNSLADGAIQEPDEYQFRFMTFCPVAYGAKGIMYWYYTSSIEDNPTKYAVVQNLNHFIHDIVGPVVMNSVLVGTYHQSNTTLNTLYPFPKDYLISNLPNNSVIRDVGNKHVLVGLFKSVNNGSDLAFARSRSIQEKEVHHALVINKDQSKIKNVRVTLNGDFRNSVNISPRVINYHSNPGQPYSQVEELEYHQDDNTTSFIIPEMEGGEAVMVEISRGQLVGNAGFGADKKGNYLVAEEIEEEYDVAVYPNPATDHILVELLPDILATKMEIFNFNGQIIRSANVFNSVNTIALSGLLSGVYVLKVTTNKGIVQKKFIKK